MAHPSNPERGVEFLDLGAPAFWADDFLFAAYPDKRFKAVAAFPASKLIYGHEAIF